MNKTNPIGGAVLQVASKESSEWFQKKIRGIFGFKENLPKGILYSRSQAQARIREMGKDRSAPVPGKLYLFTYDPKYKSVLPMWDKFPLVFPFGLARGGFMGINLHYLPYGFRNFLIENLKPTTGNLNNPENIRRVKISWQILTALAAKDSLQPAVKHYLYSHVRSSFCEIPYVEWKTASALPLQKFHYNK